MCQGTASSSRHQHPSDTHECGLWTECTLSTPFPRLQELLQHQDPANALNQSQLALVLARYPPHPNDSRAILAEFFTDFLFVCQPFKRAYDTRSSLHLTPVSDGYIYLTTI